MIHVWRERSMASPLNILKLIGSLMSIMSTNIQHPRYIVTMALITHTTSLLVTCLALSLVYTMRMHLSNAVITLLLLVILTNVIFTLKMVLVLRELLALWLGVSKVKKKAGLGSPTAIGGKASWYYVLSRTVISNPSLLALRRSDGCMGDSINAKLRGE